MLANNLHYLELSKVEMIVPVGYMKNCGGEMNIDAPGQVSTTRP